MADIVGGRERILRAALQCFARDGVAGTALGRLREAAEVSPGSFYHHFQGKEEVVAALYVRIIEDYHRDFLAELRRHPDPGHTIRSVVAFHVAWCGAHQDEARFLFTERPPGRATGLGDRNRAFFAEVDSWWNAHVHHGALRAFDLTTRHVLWLGPAQELCRLWLSGGIAAPTSQQITDLADAAWRSLGS